MLPEEVVNEVANRVSGIRAKAYVQGITGFHRIQASPGIHQALEYVKKEVAVVSDAEVKIFEYPADGTSSIETWKAPLGWYPKSGTLELIEPEQKMLGDFQAEPMALICHSQTAEIESEVVDVGKGIAPTDFENKNIKGKIVLTENRASQVHKTINLQTDAAGVLTFVPPKGIDEIGYLRRYDAFWPTKDEIDKTTFGFSLAQSDGVRIRRWLKEGKKVVVRAKVDAKLGDGKTAVLSALIKGKDETKEIWLVAHICHPQPGANDNASGSGTLLEAIRVISTLIKEEKIAKPEYSIRFLWLPEWYGTIPFIHNEPELLKRCQAMINIDMVGSNPCKAGSVLHLFRTPFSLPTTLNNVVRYWLKNESTRKDDRSIGGTIAPLPWKYDRYSAGSDHFMFTNSTVGIPAIMLNQSPDRFYHTSTDTPDQIDPRQMAYATRIAILSTLCYVLPKQTTVELLMTDCRDEAVEIMRQVVRKGVRDLSRCLGNPDELYPEVMRWLSYALELGKQTLDKAAEEWKLMVVQEELRQALKTSLDMIYTGEMMIARRAYMGACAEVGIQAKEDEQLKIKVPQDNYQILRKLKYALNPGYITDEMPERLLDYTKIREKDAYILSKIDEILNLSTDWIDIEKAFDKIRFQFPDTDTDLLDTIIDDLITLDILEKKEA
jgi:aminopeptidase-like protein